MRCKSPLDSSLCWVDKHFVHSYGSYDSTTITRGLLPTKQATKFPSLLNEMQKSTRQFTLSGGQALHEHFVHSYGSYDSTTITRGLLPTKQATKFLSLPNEMQKSARQFTLSGGQALCPLVRLVRLDYHYTGSLTNKSSDKISKSP